MDLSCLEVASAAAANAAIAVPWIEAPGLFSDVHLKFTAHFVNE